MRYTLQKLRINRSGYDSVTGAYYGRGLPVYFAQADDLTAARESSVAREYYEFRAKDREAAKQYVLMMNPEATFYR
jgi:hypothetical protein